MIRSFLPLCLGALTFLSVTAHSGIAAADGAALDDATDVQKQAAQIRYVQGMEAFREGKYEAARKGFNDSFETVASPNSLLMVVRSLVELKRDVEAYEQATKTARLAEAAAKSAPKYAATAEAARTEAARLRQLIGFVTVMGIGGAPEGTKLMVGGREIPREAWGAPIATAPGDVAITVNDKPLKSGGVTAGNTASVDARPVVAELVSQQQTGPGTTESGNTGEDTGPRVGSYRGPDRLLMAGIAGGVGVAGFVATAAFGVLAQDQFSDLETACPNRQCPTRELQDEADTGQTYQTVSNTGLVVGVIGAVTAGTLVAWYFIDPPAAEQQEDNDAEPSTSAQGPSLRVGVGVGPTQLSLQGTF